MNDTKSIANVFLQQEDGNGASVYTDTAGLLTLEKGRASRILKYKNQPGVPMRMIYLLPSATPASSAESGFKLTILDMTKLEYYYDAATAGRLSTWAIIMMISGGVIVLFGFCAYCLCCRGKKGSATGDDDGYQRVSSSNNRKSNSNSQGAGGAQGPR